jgi:multidrug transporter EmrE-like cation transporter
MSASLWYDMTGYLHGKKHLCFLLLSILIQAFGAICTKYAAESNSTDTLLGVPLYLVIYLFILGGMGCQVLVWQIALEYYPLSFAYPFRSMVSFLVLISAFLLFQESVSLMNVAGLSVITIGVYFLANDKEETFA